MIYIGRLLVPLKVGWPVHYINVLCWNCIITCFSGVPKSFPSFRRNQVHNVNDKRTKFSNKEVMLQVGVGQIENGLFTRVRRSQKTDLGGLLPIGPMSIHTGAEEILVMAVTRWCEMGYFRNTNVQNYCLVYPGGQSVNKTPDGKNEFTIDNYKNYEKCAYSKLRLYVIEKGKFLCT